MRNIFLAAALLVVAGAAWAGYAYRGAIYAQLDDFRLIPRPEAFTELYFSDFTKLSGSLPHTIKAGESISFSFIVHNVEGKTRSYPYVIYIVDDTGATTTIASSTTTLEAGAYATIPQNYTFRSAQGRVSVWVTLTDLAQSIHFFIPSTP